ncbi:MAG: hypothetical protein QHJ73_04635 [Armatimonadota bacterium]|nr:hypothetical protein [Armatimonadota bacterium]
MTSHNLSEIYRLNQRGGRPLSLLDLVAANTLDLSVAAFLAGAVAGGATLLTAARPGNAGKTTLLAAALAFVPPHRPIVAVGHPGVLEKAPRRCCLLAHEIGDGPYYGYLWGKEARRFFQMADGERSAVSCIHADTLEELHAILCGNAIGLPEEAFRRIDVVAFLRLDRTLRGYRRRVSAVYAVDPGSGRHRRAYVWDDTSDTYFAENPPACWEKWVERARGVLGELVAQGETEFEQVYARAQT